MAFVFHEFIDMILDAIVSPLGTDSPLWLAKVIGWVIASVILFTVALASGGLFTFVFRGNGPCIAGGFQGDPQ